jgi:hypothetical protein
MLYQALNTIQVSLKCKDSPHDMQDMSQIPSSSILSDIYKGWVESCIISLISMIAYMLMMLLTLHIKISTTPCHLVMTLRQLSQDPVDVSLGYCKARPTFKRI